MSGLVVARQLLHDLLFHILRRVKSMLFSVGRILVNIQLQVLTELLGELVEIILIFSCLLDEIHAFLQQVLLYYLEDLVQLQRLSGDVHDTYSLMSSGGSGGTVMGSRILPSLTKNFISGSLRSGSTSLLAGSFSLRMWTSQIVAPSW